MEAVWTRVAAFALCREGRQILLTRFTGPGHPDHGKWTMPGGRIEWGESPRETARRELEEETGLVATLGAIVGVFSRWFTAQESVRGEAGHTVGIVFEASDVAGDLRVEFDRGDTTDAAQWFSIDDVAALPHVELVDFVLNLLE